MGREVKDRDRIERQSKRWTLTDVNGVNNKYENVNQKEDSNFWGTCILVINGSMDFVQSLRIVHLSFCMSWTIYWLSY